MSDLRTLVDKEMDRAGSPSYSFEDLGRRRDRKRRNQRMMAGVVAIVVALLSLATLARAFLGSERPASEPTPSLSPETPSPSPKGIFAHVGGWIVYGDWRLSNGIWAVNPTRPGDPQDQILLSERGGEPLGWSSDGSKLLIRRQVPDANGGFIDLALFVLNADGTERRLTTGDWITGSISPDGSQVVSASLPGPSTPSIRREASHATSLPGPVARSGTQQEGPSVSARGCTTRRSPRMVLRSRISTAGATTATASGS
jgi:hypothetical protein